VNTLKLVPANGEAQTLLHQPKERFWGVHHSATTTRVAARIKGSQFRQRYACPHLRNADMSDAQRFRVREGQV
jgi:hypothetical protein